MLTLELMFEDGRSEVTTYTLPLVVGRDEACGLRVKSWRVGRQHARLAERSGTLFIEDLGTLAGTYVNGRRITEYGPLVIGDEVIIGPCCMLLAGISAETGGKRVPSCDDEKKLGGGAESAKQKPIITQTEGYASTPCHPLDGTPDITSDANTDDHTDNRTDNRTDNHTDNNTDGTLERTPEATSLSSPHSTAHIPTPTHDSVAPTPCQHERLTAVQHRRRLHKSLLEALDLRRRDILSLSDAALRHEATQALANLLEHDKQFPAELDRHEILQQVVDEAVGLGPLEPLLADRGVSEIMVNSYEDIYVERKGRLQRHCTSFSSEQAVAAVIDRIIAPLGRRIDESSPMVDARLRDGSRVNAVIPPIALRGACLTIRKFPARRLDMKDLLGVGSLDCHMAAFLERCVAARKSLVVSGGTGSGKTTLLNVLSNCIPSAERLITIEDAAELRLNHAHLVSLEARPANAEGKGSIQIRDLVRNALRMRPDRIIVGECRGAEAFDMLAAMNTGHEGSLTTLHANSPRDALSRLETMVLMAGMDLPLTAIREHIASALQLIVQQTRLSDGRRLVTSIVEVTGIESGRIQTQELFRYGGAPDPHFEGCGVQPECFAGDPEGVPMHWLTQTTVLPVEKGMLSW